MARKKKEIREKKEKTSGKTLKKATKTPEKKHGTRAEGGQRFWLHENGPLSDLIELAVALRGMGEGQWRHHVLPGRKGKNDFASWVADVLHEGACAKGLKSAKTSAAALKVIEKYL